MIERDKQHTESEAKAIIHDVDRNKKLHRLGTLSEYGNIKVRA